MQPVPAKVTVVSTKPTALALYQASRYELPPLSSMRRTRLSPSEMTSAPAVSLAVRLAQAASVTSDGLPKWPPICTDPAPAKLMTLPRVASFTAVAPLTTPSQLPVASAPRLPALSNVYSAVGPGAQVVVTVRLAAPL